MFIKSSLGAVLEVTLFWILNVLGVLGCNYGHLQKLKYNVNGTTWSNRWAKHQLFGTKPSLENEAGKGICSCFFKDVAIFFPEWL